MHHGQVNYCSESERQALKEYLAFGPERSVEDVKTFIATNFETDISNDWTFPVLMQSIYYDKAVDAYEASGATIPRFPGFGLSLNCKTDFGADVFPRLAFRRDGQTNWKANTLLHREVCMLRVLEELTNKPEWWLKVKNDEIAAKWKTEVLQMDWKTLVGLWAVFTESMADAVIAELRAKADLYQQTGLIPVMDYSACAIKSDKLMSSELVGRLKAALAPFENVSDEAKDWHPGSDGKVLDLVHPSLWPLIYGRSRVLPDKTIGLTDCLKHAGTGYTLPTIDTGKLIKDASRNTRADDRLEMSTRYQWLPCEVKVGPDGRATIDSYINNVHPVRNASLYPVIEEFINISLPAWDLVYRWPQEFEFKRQHWDSIYNWDCLAPDFCKGDCDPRKCPVESGGIRPPNDDGEESDSDYDEDAYWDMERGDAREQWFAANHVMKLPDPEPEKYCKNFAASGCMPAAKSELFGAGAKLQVIVKLASIHLTPEKPTYDGGSWHTEGQLNERIVSTALFYYDSDNITDSALAFRTCCNKEDLMMEGFYEQSDMMGIERALAIDANGNTLQDVGQVQTRPGRALFFPNLYQHRVSPFELVDRTKPGHRKILALFLVDPKVPVLSTANVPPQQREWWEQEVSMSADEIVSRRLPNEIRDMVMNDIDFPISLEEAKKIREDLMSERKVLVEDTQSKWNYTEFNFCEH